VAARNEAALATPIDRAARVLARFGQVPCFGRGQRDPPRAASITELAEVLSKSLPK